ncbi:hypothetical protein BN874_2910002 [Candidatus Contendobacter odensis Run_B_J11]|uniref:Uncharacterized protein n=1 Tax=Candidatus Contendobacter odensis Run_B_J11 TaxID=1400861 RepID=A0A7U7GCX1_9GAMM|nr:hypothetical protein BN874_2910002 [Candidatus Contendobacter odensis Run_B_J11]
MTPFHSQLGNMDPFRQYGLTAYLWESLRHIPLMENSQKSGVLCRFHWFRQIYWVLFLNPFKVN